LSSQLRRSSRSAGPGVRSGTYEGVGHVGFVMAAGVRTSAVYRDLPLVQCEGITSVCEPVGKRIRVAVLQGQAVDGNLAP
jgi:hypothetical protein